MSTPEVDEPLSQSEIVIRGVKELILTGKLGPGDRLPVERDLAEVFGVSRGSLREGIRALVQIGVLNTRQGDGTYVTTLDPAVLLSPLRILTELHSGSDAVHLLVVRRVLESESVAQAALRIEQKQLEEIASILDAVDEMFIDLPDVDLQKFIDADIEFHQAIARASGNPPLAALIDGLGDRTRRARLWRAIEDRGALQQTQSEHRAILAELEQREPTRARIRMEAHLLGVERFALDVGEKDDLAVDSPGLAEE